MKDHLLNREKLIKDIEEKVDGVTREWPEWKHEVLQNCFRSENPLPRQVIEPLTTDIGE